jgi:hypothetical protein
VQIIRNNFLETYSAIRNLALGFREVLKAFDFVAHAALNLHKCV